MQAIDFWFLAIRLIANENTPAGYRSAISRSYYAAFLTALAFLEEMGITIPNREQSHRRILDILTATGDVAVDAASRRLGSLRKDRNLADYDLSNKRIETEPEARPRYQDAGDIIGTLNTCRQTIGIAGGR